VPGVARAVAINGTCVLVKVLASQPAWWGEQLVVKLIHGIRQFSQELRTIQEGRCDWPTTREAVVVSSRSAITPTTVKAPQHSCQCSHPRLVDRRTRCAARRVRSRPFNPGEGGSKPTPVSASAPGALPNQWTPCGPSRAIRRRTPGPRAPAPRALVVGVPGPAPPPRPRPPRGRRQGRRRRGPGPATPSRQRRFTRTTM
jgi:hypothetical protein